MGTWAPSAQKTEETGQGGWISCSPASDTAWALETSGGFPTGLTPTEEVPVHPLEWSVFHPLTWAGRTSLKKHPFPFLGLESSTCCGVKLV